MTNRITVVFDCDITRFRGNPHRADTPFGRPISIMRGDYRDDPSDDAGEQIARTAVASVTPPANAWPDFCAIDNATLAAMMADHTAMEVQRRAAGIDRGQE